MDKQDINPELAEAARKWIGADLIAYSMAELHSPGTNFPWTLLGVTEEALFFKFFNSKSLVQTVAFNSEINDGPMVEIGKNDISKIRITKEKKLFNLIILQEGNIRIWLNKNVTVPPDTASKEISLTPVISIEILENVFGEYYKNILA